MSTPASNAKQPLFIIATLGVVYGDIGTSPLYAMRNCFQLYHLDINPMNILGIISLIFWSLIIVVSFKYIRIILKANNHGEGGILSLLTLCTGLGSPRLQKFVLFLGILGTALFYGDGVITPAISVLGALEGLQVISASYTHYIPFLAIAILTLLFVVQKNGSHVIGNMFGPIMILWFAVLAMLGLYQILQAPEVLNALNPYHALRFFIANGLKSILTFGAIVLVVTGAEALYADLGHFSLRSIQLTWKYVVLPALSLNYFGQGALLMHTPAGIENPFYLMAPDWSLYPLLLLATLATIIASQAIISGIFSISWQAIQLDYFPRMRVIHTSAKQIGQVYLPVINYLLLFATILAVIIFGNSNNLASAYGITITWIMMITSTLAIIFTFYRWNWPRYKIAMIFAPLLLLDFVFFTTSSMKFFKGGWFPLLIAFLVYMIISSWRKGREALTHERKTTQQDLIPYINEIISEHRQRIPGTAIFMCRSSDKVPTTLEIHLKHNKFLHEKVIFLSIITHNKPKVASGARIYVHEVADNVYQVMANYGFVEVPNLLSIMHQIKKAGVDFDFHDTSFMTSRGLPVASNEIYLTGITEMLFIFLSHNAINATEFFQIPYDQVVEYGVKFKV
ncbi:MAG: potassium transporter Kup [Gammaproteobacteria bacterium]